MSTSKRTVFWIWLAWAAALLAFQALAAARFQPARPDYSMGWTPSETEVDSHLDKPALINPFMNNQVAWDSEFYISIATHGYDDPEVRGLQIPNGRRITLNYAFLPFYPTLIRVVALPFNLLGMAAIPAATLAGVIVSLLGTLGGMLALHDLARGELGEEGGLRAAFYLIIFPAGFFLAQVYTEGLFVGLAFGCLALLRRGQFGWAALLGAAAALTRAVGVALALPLLLAWLERGHYLDLDLEWKQLYLQGVPWRGLGRAALYAAPVIAFLGWKFSPLGSGFSIIEENFFGRGFFSTGTSFFTWLGAARSLFGDNPQRAAYYVVEFLAIGIGFTACFWLLRQDRGLGLYSLAVVLLSFTSGPAQGMHRYVMGAPAVFLFLAWLGRRPAFDRGWTVLSTLLMALLAILYTFNFWVG